MEFTAQIPFFFESFLSKPATALPRGAQWVIQFNSFPVRAIKKAASWEPREWRIDDALSLVCEKQDYQNAKGCLFAQAVQIPGTSMTYNPSDLQMNGYLKTYVGGGRDTSDALTIAFLDTNISFAENVIRPWVLATAAFGLISRPKDDEKYYRTDMDCYMLGITQKDVPPVIMQKITFTGVCPVTIDAVERNYAPVSAPTVRQSTFVYNYYTVDTSTSLEITRY